MARPYTRKKHITLTLYDGGANELELTCYADVPEIPEPIIRVDPEPYYCQGTFESIEEADDTIEFADFSITCDIADSGVDASEKVLAVDQWINHFKTDDGTAPLTSTNSGTIQVRDSQTKSLESLGFPTDWKTIGMKIEFDNNEDGKDFGKKWEHCQPVSALFSTSGNAQVTINLRILCAGVDIT
jgi:hypothetical protein